MTRWQKHARLSLVPGVATVGSSMALADLRRVSGSSGASSTTDTRGGGKR